MIVLELEVIKETPQKRITLVRELDKRNIYIKKELKTFERILVWNMKIEVLNMSENKVIYKQFNLDAVQ